MIHFGKNPTPVRQLSVLSDNYGTVFYPVHSRDIGFVSLASLRVSWL